jgi:hypothetical protein
MFEMNLKSIDATLSFMLYYIYIGYSVIYIWLNDWKYSYLASKISKLANEKIIKITLTFSDERYVW